MGKQLNNWSERRGFVPLVAVVAGAISATGFEPLHLWVLLLAGLAVLAALGFRQQRPGRAFLVGWLFGVGHFCVGNNWIATAFTYQAAMPAWLGWIAVFLLSLYLAVYPGLAVLGAWALARRSRIIARSSPAAFALALAGCWAISEFLRGEMFTGFAWNPVGVALVGGFDRPGAVGWLAPWMGTYALSGLVLACAGAWWIAMRAAMMDRDQLKRALPLALIGLLLFVPWPAPAEEQGTLEFRLVQPDIRQEVLNEPQFYERNFLRSVELTGAPAKEDETRLVLWPESGVPDYLENGYPQRYYRQATFAADPDIARDRIAALMGPGAMLVTGSVDLVIGNENRAIAAENVVTAIGPDGEIAASYAKSHLVPYGEYLPMRSLLEPLGVTRLVPGSIDFRPGPGPRTLDLGRWGQAGIQLCYEIVFSGEVVDSENRPDYIVNPSNDGWFGAWGPPQHLAQARLRAMEEGLPVMRSTTTGISAVIDANGVVRDHIGTYRSGRIDGLVPPAHAPTAFARMGIWLSLAWALVLLALAMVALRRRRG